MFVSGQGVRTRLRVKWAQDPNVHSANIVTCEFERHCCELIIRSLLHKTVRVNRQGVLVKRATTGRTPEPPSAVSSVVVNILSSCI